MEVKRLPFTVRKSPWRVFPCHPSSRLKPFLLLLLWKHGRGRAEKQWSHLEPVHSICADDLQFREQSKLRKPALLCTHSQIMMFSQTDYPPRKPGHLCIPGKSEHWMLPFWSGGVCSTHSTLTEIFAIALAQLSVRSIKWRNWSVKTSY